MKQNQLKTILSTFMPCFLIGTSFCAVADDIVELPRDIEIELALSALPEALQDGATIYVRDSEKGFTLHREGTNGFTTFVARTSTRFYQADWEYSYPSDQLIPIAFDAVGVEHHLLPWFDIERMRIEGVPPEEARRTLRERFGDGTYRAPAKGGLSYMFSPIHRAYGAPAQSDETITVRRCGLGSWRSRMCGRRTPTSSSSLGGASDT